MAKKNKFWDENKITMIPLLCCAGLLGLFAGIWVVNRNYTDAQWERKHAERVAAAADSMHQVKDTIAFSAANQRQK